MKNVKSNSIKSLNARPPKASIRRDPIPAWAYLYLNQPSSCEECTHFQFFTQSCTLGNDTRWHLQAFQMAEYQRSGHIAICRFMEID